jgi:hypothetical protein
MRNRKQPRNENGRKIIKNRLARKYKKEIKSGDEKDILMRKKNEPETESMNTNIETK